MPQQDDEDFDRVDDIVVTPTAEQLRDREEQREVHWFLDAVGWDSGSFRPGDIGWDSGHTVVTVLGVSGAVPLGAEPGYVGVNVGLDFDVTDGNVGVDLNGVEYDPSLDPGLSIEGVHVSYYHEIPSPTGGYSMYPVPGGEYGDYYWGPPPGSLGNEGSF